ncbi:MAG: putative tricarboxylic transport rane protein [Hyphomicrobiales bacterium]|jgi:putative tricarboxylic transport membrane protein|nr:putative tricarboxylic transport rane protein [Hyphomicrobiales bacterium]MEA2876485.1 putative tricarboxylic transport rane protein [Hyphomicrobiales bacterium]
MDLLANLALGFGVVFQFVDLKIAFLNITIPFPMNIFLCFVGAMVGTLIGVLPGIGPLATIAMLLPITFGLPPVGALIMLAGIYYGAQYGGSTTSILINIPGESSSVVTALDGHQMAKQGRAGPALAIAAIGSFIAGTFSTVLVAALGVPLTAVALKFGPAEYFSLMVLGLVFAVVLARGSVLKALAMIMMGLLMSTVGSDIETGQSRMAFDIPELADGIGFVVVAMGVFGYAEIMRNLETTESREIVQAKVTGLMPTMKDLKDSSGAIARGTILGSILGILPGGGAVIAAFAAYTFEKKMSRTPERFGHGAIEGVAAPESANNAAAQTSFIPLLTLGIPPNAVMALMVGAMTIHGIVPGPQVMTKQPELFWGLIASMWIGNLMLVVINLPLVGLWVRLLRVPYRMLFPAILIFCAIGVYSINNAPADAVMVAAFGLVGYWLVKHDFEPAPMLLGFVLGPLMEENLRRAMLIARGDPSTFLTRPISGVLLALAMLLLVLALLPMIRKKRDEVFVEEST